MRLYPVCLLLPLLTLITCSALANDPSQISKLIKTAVTEVAASTAIDPEKKSPDSTAKETRAQKKARLKDERAADELAAKIADSVAAVRKNNPISKLDQENYAAAAAAASVRSNSYLRSSARTAARSRSGKSESAVAKIDPQDWTYEGAAGPDNWSKLSPLYQQCSKGERQTPIDLHDGFKVDLDPLTFDYQPSRFSVLNNGHTISVDPGNANHLRVSGRDYTLIGFHFHHPAENSVNGKRAEMVMHLVHQDEDGKLAVVALMMEVGSSNPLIQQVWNNLPLEKNVPVRAVSTIELNMLMPDKLDYYTFMGSLTTPPCTEGVLWIVLKQAIEISADQLAIFSRLYPMNARPTQTSSARLIKESR